jgi:hypothetical protein
LNELLKELFFYGCLSAAELLMIDDSDNELNELATADLAFDGKNIFFIFSRFISLWFQLS